VLRGLPVRGFVLRPSLIVGAENASLRQFRRLARLPLIPVPGGPEQWVQPVHIEDLVDSVLCCLVSTAPGGTFDLVGPEPMTFRDFLARLRGDGRARYLRIPLPLVRGVMHLARHLSPVLHPDNLRMLQQGNTADAAPVTALLGHRPRAMEGR
jgi:NAD dependent epimerase/dehydratase family enzyme